MRHLMRLNIFCLLILAGGCASENTKAKQSAPKTFIEKAYEKKAPAPSKASQSGAKTPAKTSSITELLYISGDQVNVRSAPSIQAEIRGQRHQGDRVELLPKPAVEADGYQWRLMVWPDGKEAWVAQKFLSFDPPPQE